MKEKTLIECNVYKHTDPWGGGHYIVPIEVDVIKLELSDLGDRMGTFTFDKEYLDDVICSMGRDGFKWWEDTWTV